MRSDDLTERLRNADIGVCDEAADEIDRLRAERDALTAYVDSIIEADSAELSTLREIVRVLDVWITAIPTLAIGRLYDITPAQAERYRDVIDQAMEADRE